MRSTWPYPSSGRSRSTMSSSDRPGSLRGEIPRPSNVISPFDFKEHPMRRFLLAFATLAVALAAGTATPAAEPIKALIITGDNVAAHDWKGTTQMLQDFL